MSSLSGAAAADLIAEHRWETFQSRDGDGFGEDRFVRRLRKVRREDLDTVLGLLRAQSTISDPMKGTVYARAGTWHAGPVDLVWAQGDEERKDLDIHQILYRGDLATGYVVTEGNCRYTVERDWRYGQTEIPTLPAKDPLLGVSYAMGPVSTNPETGRFTTYIEKRTRLTQVVADHVVRSDAAGVESEAAWLGLKAGDKDDAGNVVALQDMTPVQGVVKSRTRRKSEDCTDDVTDGLRTLTDQTRTSHAVSAAGVSETVDHTEAADPVEQPAAEQGTVVKVSNAPAGSGSGNTATRVETDTPTDQTRTSHAVSASGVSETVEHTEAADPLEQPAAEQGKVVQVRNAPAPSGSGNTATRVVTDTPADQTRTSHAVSAAGVSETVEHTEAVDPVEQPAAEQGKVVQVRNAPAGSGSGNTATRVETDTPADQSRISHEVSAAVLVTEERHTESADPLEQPAAEQGTVVRVGNAPAVSGSGNTATTLRTEVPADEERESHTVSASAETRTVRHTEAAAPVEKPAFDKGKVERVRNAPAASGSGNTATEHQTEIPKDEVRQSSRSSAAAMVRVERHTEAGDALGDATAEQGEIVEHENAPASSGSGNTRTQVTTTTPQDQVRSSKILLPRRVVDVVEHTESPDPAALQGPQKGKKLTVTNRPSSSGSGNTATRVETDEPENLPRAESVVEAGRTLTREGNSQASSPLDAPSGDAVMGTVRRVMSAMNELDQYETMDETQIYSLLQAEVTYADRFGTVRSGGGVHATEGEVAAIVASLSEENANSMTVTPRAAGISYSLTSRPVRPTTTVTDSYPVGEKTRQRKERKLVRGEGGKLQWSVVTWERKEKYVTSLADVVSHHDGAGEDVAAFGKNSITLATGDRIFFSYYDTFISSEMIDADDT